jgi:hypothetical protein
MRQARQGLFMPVMLGVVVVNYVAQVVYYFHLYYPARLPLGTITLGATCAWFLAGFALLRRGAKLGYWLLLSYLLAMVGFYVHNMVIQALNGIVPFFHLREPDGVLFVVFAIGYLNMLAGAWFIFYLLRHYRALVGQPPITSAGPQIG